MQELQNYAVSIHAPTQGATPANIRGMFAVEFQSTHPRRVRLDTLHVTGHFAVSIHAPTQGATLMTNSRLCTGMFQSTHPRRVRRRSASLSDCSCVVSIHAPTQGATEQIQDEVRLFLFQSTHPRRVRRMVAQVTLAQWFQSTHPRRVRLTAEFQRLVGRGFNPRTHAGCDDAGGQVLAEERVSIHAPTQGATQLQATSVFSVTFQSTHPRRVRLDSGMRLRLVGVSIHAPTQGATHCRAEVVAADDVSIHAPTQGATGVHRNGGFARDVSIHAPTQGATQPHTQH